MRPRRKSRKIQLGEGALNTAVYWEKRDEKHTKENENVAEEEDTDIVLVHEVLRNQFPLVDGLQLPLSQNDGFIPVQDKWHVSVKMVIIAFLKIFVSP